MSQNRSLLALDVGEKRIGAAVGDAQIRIAVPLAVIEVDGKELERIAELVISERADTIVVGYPRNQAGEPTAQTAYVEAFVSQLADLPARTVFQDESTTSLMAEHILKEHGKPYSKGDIDAQAAAIILQDYMEHLTDE